MKTMNVVQEQPKSRHLMMKAAGGLRKGVGREKQIQQEERTGLTQWSEAELARVNCDKVQEEESKCCVLPQVLPIRGRWAISIPPWAEMEKFKVKEGMMEDQHQNQLPRLIPLQRSTVPWKWCHQPRLPVKEWPHGKRDFPYLVEASKPIKAQLSGNSWVFASYFTLQVQFLPGCHVPLSQFAS